MQFITLTKSKDNKKIMIRPEDIEIINEDITTTIIECGNYRVSVYETVEEITKMLNEMED